MMFANNRSDAFSRYKMLVLPDTVYTTSACQYSPIRSKTY